MARRLVGRGFTAAYIRKKDAIVPASGSRKICLGTAGDFRGRTTAVLFTTAHRRSRMGRHGVNARSWSGGTPRKKNGEGSTTPITRKTWRLTRRTSLQAEREWKLSVERGRSRCIRMAWDGFMLRAD